MVQATHKITGKIFHDLLSVLSNLKFLEGAKAIVLKNTLRLTWLLLDFNDRGGGSWVTAFLSTELGEESCTISEIESESSLLSFI